MSIKIALAGNPNCGKTTLFNALTGANQYVGNWPGVTVEKKEGKLKDNKEVVIQDLPGIYSLSPYTLEEVISRQYLVSEKPDAILNIIDGTNIERNLYLTTQLSELGIPMVIAINMIDLVRKNGDNIDVAKLSKEFKCDVVEISALKKESIKDVTDKAVKAAESKKKMEPLNILSPEVESVVSEIEGLISDKVDASLLRWYAIKIFERDEKVLENLSLGSAADNIEKIIEDAEKKLDDDSESIITNERYNYIAGVTSKTVKKKRAKGELSASDKIDKVVTNRILGLPIFAGIMFLIYAIAMGGWKVSIGTMAT
ncbi:MAG: ferrous iron transporter B, partial [Lachnospiraceae bacterium]|nr:ferrous iron transporter B [Lachnospiraceae bacterium]